MHVLPVLVFLIVTSLPALAETVSVSSHDPVFCKIIMGHTPREDVAYHPEAYHVPPDLNGESIEITREVVIPLSLELGEYFQIRVPQGVELKPELAVLRIKGDGRVFWNDRELTREALSYCNTKAEKDEPVAKEIIEAEPTDPAQHLLDDRE